MNELLGEESLILLHVSENRDIRFDTRVKQKEDVLMEPAVNDRVSQGYFSTWNQWPQNP